jgi:hypothetical protein
MSQYPLYDGVPPHENDPETSLEAALSIAPFVNTLQERVYRLVSSRGKDGATVDEIEAALGMLHQTASARARELVQLGKLKHAGRDRRLPGSPASGARGAATPCRNHGCGRRLAEYRGRYRD